MLSRRRFISCGAVSVAQAWSPALFAAHPIAYVIYHRSKELDDTLEYRELLLELLPDNVSSSLQVVTTADHDYALAIELKGSSALRKARELAHTHNQQLLAALGIVATYKPIGMNQSSLAPTYHLSYGRYKEVDHVMLALQRLLHKLDTEYRNQLVVERTENGELELILRLYTSRIKALRLAKRHKTLVAAPVRIVKDKIRFTQLSAASLQIQQAISEPSGSDIVRHRSQLRLRSAYAPDDKAPYSGPQASHSRVIEASSSRVIQSSGSAFFEHPKLRPSVHTRLRNQLNLYIQRLRKQNQVDRDEQTSWYVYTLHDDQTWVSINGDARRQTASMIKPIIGLAYFDQALTNNWPYSVTVQRQLQYMIAHSSNSATNWFLDHLGGPRAVDRLLRRKYSHLFKETRIVEKIPPNGRTYRNRASAMDYVRFCRALWHREVPGASQLLRDMALSRTNRLVKRADNIPSHTYVMNKTGSTARLVGDFGIVIAQTRQGHQIPYVMVGVIEKNERVDGDTAYRQWRASRAKVIGKASDVVYLHLKQKYNLV